MHELRHGDRAALKAVVLLGLLLELGRYRFRERAEEERRELEAAEEGEGGQVSARLRVGRSEGRGRTSPSESVGLLSLGGG